MEIVKKSVTYYSTLLVWMRIFIFEMNLRKEALIHVYGYIGNAKSWFLKSQHTVRFLLYENLDFSQKWKKISLFKIEFPAFSQKVSVLEFQKSWFCRVYVSINMDKCLFFGVHFENEYPHSNQQWCICDELKNSRNISAHFCRWPRPAA